MIEREINMPQDAIQEAIKREMSQRKMSQRDLADALGLHETSVSRVLAEDYTPQLASSALQAILDFYGLELRTRKKRS